MRALTFLAAALLLVLVQGNLWRVLGPLGVQGATPSLALPLVVWLGVHEPSTVRGSAIAFAIGYLTDLLASAPVGLFTLASVAVWWLARLLGVRVSGTGYVSRMVVGLLFAAVEGALVLVLLAIFGTDPRRPVELFANLVPHALCTSLVAPWVFRLAARLGQSTAPAAEGAAR